ncbi:hypothetical protein LVY72_05260 [Arthrobacter sp. I2-34]|uniref:Transposase n=1 Tax=Arthrobacter hankyongi TaxID=2904801 RepID=A0ABS9L3Y1_9MICC|nr:hypothetical protein [Arthrobacter hankyongi]MCG2621321.1 hypothetical protein [Arthrobacter hankyongi]
MDFRTEVARAQGIDIHRRQVRQVLLQEGVRWRRTRPDGSAHRVPAPGGSPDGHRGKSELDYGRGPEKTRVCGVLRPAGRTP